MAARYATRASPPWHRGAANGSNAPLKRKILVALGWAGIAAIIWLSLTPSPPTVGFETSDKAAHFFAYGALMLWFSLLYSKATSRLVYAAGFVAMGIGLEFLQGTLGHRTYEMFDIVADTIGVLLGLALGLVLERLAGAGATAR
jgi:VanZ family protein